MQQQTGPGTLREFSLIWILLELVSSHPYWRLKNGLCGSFPTLGQDISCDILVVGGGISGALISRELIAAGYDVVLAEKFDVGAESTAGSTALLQYELDFSLLELSQIYGNAFANQVYQTSYDSLDKIKDIANVISHKFLREQKSFYLASNDKDAEGLRLETKARKEIGIGAEFLDRQQIESKFSFSRPGAIFSEKSLQIDPYLFTYDLIKWSVAKGLKVFDRTGIIDYQCSADGVVSTTDSGYQVRSKQIVIATGYETSKLIPSGLVDLNSSFAIVSKPLSNFDGWYEQSLLWETARPYLYLRTTLDNRAIIGGLDEDFQNPIHRDALIGKKRFELEKLFYSLFPKIKFETAYAWAGTFGETKDGLPYVGILPDYPNCYFCCGFGGNGITYSAIASEIITKQISGESQKNAKLFSFDRNVLK